ncbi:hypothetical protein PSU4_17860 [Pseudonocardia sulfidoxydans NBRC 16205]|uniref:Uncharacterized protein n=1 Tax=Pseudonocardia sulfidoxydans NBRC 16205 TaxID=1223511 RepID=A0A511DDG1_9PSEU|nr:hypothetical protein [Pseudonocardia sulfidoxydans]GEL22832.1 hypothetical protein PSU4_17860 [Pseudonocardia sulfidoxydans NBRC 16205]
MDVLTGPGLRSNLDRLDEVLRADGIGRERPVAVLTTPSPNSGYRTTS